MKNTFGQEMDDESKMASAGVPQPAPAPREYVINGEQRARIENNFVHHPPKDLETGDRYAAIRNRLKEAAYFVCAKTPASREQALALTKLEEAMFWANAAIARNE